MLSIATFSVLGVNVPPISAFDVDLDIDSDNDNSYHRPEEDDNEERMEMTSPGKIIMVNRDDDDYDDVRDCDDEFMNGADDRDDMAVLVIKCLPNKWDSSEYELVLEASRYDCIRVFSWSGFFMLGPEIPYARSIVPSWLEDGDGRMYLVVEGLKAGETKLSLIMKKRHGGNVVARDDVLVTVADVKCKLLWETANKANQIFNPTPKDDPPGIPSNKLYVVESPADDKYHVTLEVNDQPFYVRSKLMYAVVSEFGDKIANGYFPPNGPANITFDHPDIKLGVTSDFDIKVGCDFNGNGSLDEEEGFPIEVSNATGEGIGFAKVCGADTATYDWAGEMVALEISGNPYSHARELLRLFRDGLIENLPSDKQPSTIGASILNCFSGDYSEWLTHNCGASFSSAGAAVIPNYVWTKNTSFALAAGECANLKAAAKIKFDRDIMPYAIAYFDMLPDEHEATFPSGNGTVDIPWVSESLGWPYITTTFVDLWGDMNGAIGRGRISTHKARYTVEKGSSWGVVTYTVTALFHTGVVEDLYDWNREAGSICIPPAIMQIGHGNGTYGAARDKGIIYRDRIEFETTLANPFN